MSVLLDTVSVFGIVLHHLSRAYLARPVYLPKITEPSRVAPNGIPQQPLQHLFRLVAIVGSKECEEETEEIATLALRLLHIVRGNIADGCRLTLLLHFLLLCSLPVKEKSLVVLCSGCS